MNLRFEGTVLRTHHFFVCFLLILFLAIQSALAQTTPNIEAYGKRPEIRSMTLSPSGDQVAFIAELPQKNGHEILFTYSVIEGIQPILDVSELDGNYVTFIDDTTVILRGYNHLKAAGFGNAFEYSQIIAINLVNKKNVSILENPRNGMNPVFAQLGRIDGLLDSGELLVPLWTTNGGQPERRLFKANMDSGKGRLYHRGSKYTLNWLVSRSGVLLAREDMNERRNVYTIFTKQGGPLRTLYETEAPTPPFRVVGVLPDSSALVLESLRFNTAPFFLLDFNGDIRPFEFVQANRGDVSAITDINGTFWGVRYSHLFDEFSFLDTALQSAVDHFNTTQPDLLIDILEIAENGSTILAKIFSSTINERYVLINVANNAVTVISPTRSSIPDAALNPVSGVEYPSRDGLTIPAVLTLPRQQNDPRPAIILPHGGPRAHDKIQFDWLAQYFASRGYVVLQPNFRGSSGFGDEFMRAGNGEWGTKMQDDITDGLNWLEQKGLIDPQRACIVGWSYGGYAALMGGATTPERYKCVVAIAPVTDLKSVFIETKRKSGYTSFVLEYWKQMIGDPKSQKEILEARSPINLADKFTAPVLLIHGEIDRVVDIKQSKRMQRALKKAGIPVKFVEIEEDGHSLLESEKRLEMLKTVSEFIDTHLDE